MSSVSPPPSPSSSPPSPSSSSSYSGKGSPGRSPTALRSHAGAGSPSSSGSSDLGFEELWKKAGAEAEAEAASAFAAGRDPFYRRYAARGTAKATKEELEGKFNKLLPSSHSDSEDSDSDAGSRHPSPATATVKSDSPSTLFPAPQMTKEAQNVESRAEKAIANLTTEEDGTGADVSSVLEHMKTATVAAENILEGLSNFSQHTVPIVELLIPSKTIPEQACEALEVYKKKPTLDIHKTVGDILKHLDKIDKNNFTATHADLENTQDALETWNNAKKRAFSEIENLCIPQNSTKALEYIINLTKDTDETDADTAGKLNNIHVLTNTE